MKKIIKGFILSLLCLGISSCSNKDNVTKTDLIFSEIVEGTSENRALELYNKSDKEIDLGKYSIDIQLMSGVRTISLEGTLSSKTTYVITYSNSNEELKSKADLISDNLMFNGSQPLQLKKGNKVVDVLGTIDTVYEYNKNITLTRKKEFLEGRKQFDEYDWIRYNVDNYKYLDTIEPSITNIELLEGPKLTEEDFNRPYYIEQENGTFLGGGGVMDVTVKSYVDGDTTCFYYDEEIINALGIAQGTKLRYQNINTPESYVGNIQKFGLKAKEYTKSRLSSALDIKVQSLLNGILTETFDRMLGWVWIDGELLNNTIVKMGYSNLAFDTVDEMMYKDVSYSNFLYNSELYAKKNGKGIHGEIDPYWDYENNCVKEDAQGANPNK